MKWSVKVLALLAIAGLGNSLMGMDGMYRVYGDKKAMFSFSPHSGPVKTYAVTRTIVTSGPIYTEFTEWRANPGSMTLNEGDQALLAKKYNVLAIGYDKQEARNELASVNLMIRATEDAMQRASSKELEEVLQEYEARAASLHKRLAQ